MFKYLLLFSTIFLCACRSGKTIFGIVDPILGNYQIIGVIGHQEPAYPHPNIEFTIDGNKVQTDSFGKFTYTYYLYGSDTAILHQPRKEITFRYQKHEVKLKTKWSKYFSKPRRNY